MTAISTSLEISPQPDEKLANGSRRLARLLHLDIVACSRNDADAGAGDALTEEARVLRGRELILLATDHERGRLHGRDPAHDVEGVTRLEIPEHHSGRILGRCPMQRRPQLGGRLGADGEAHQQTHALMVVVREQVEQPRQHAEARAGTDQDEAIRALPTGQRKLLGNRPSHRVSADDDPRDSQRVEEPGDHGGRVLDSVRDGPARPSMPGQVQGDDAPEIGQVFELAHPDIAGAPRAVHQAHRRRAGARRGIRDLTTIDRDRGHVIPLALLEAVGVRYIMPGGGSAMRQGFRVIDSDTHVNPSLDVLLRYADKELQQRIDDLQPYRRTVKTVSGRGDAEDVGSATILSVKPVRLQRVAGAKAAPAAAAARRGSRGTGGKIGSPRCGRPCPRACRSTIPPSSRSGLPPTKPTCRSCTTRLRSRRRTSPATATSGTTPRWAAAPARPGADSGFSRSCSWAGCSIAIRVCGWGPWRAGTVGCRTGSCG